MKKNKNNKALPGRHREIRIAALYCLAGAAYIVISGLVVARFANGGDTLWIEIAKGLGFVLLTALILLFLLVRDRKRFGQGETFFRTLVDSMGDAVFLLDVPARKIVYANPAASELFGYTNEEILGRNSEFLHVSREAYDEFNSRGMPRLLAGEPFHTEFDMRRKDGSVFASAHLVCLVDFADGSQFALSVLRDFTPLRHSREQLAEQAALFHQVAVNLHEVFWVTNADGSRLEYVSPAYREVWGQAPDSLFEGPENFLETVHPDDRDWVRQAQAQTLEGRYDVQYRILRPDGEVRWIWDRAKPITDENGDAYRIVGIAEDITSLKRREEQLMHNQKLEHLGRMASGITHDFRNYLSVILGNTELLQDEHEHAEELQRTLRLIRQAALDANVLTARLLTFSRKQSLQAQPVRLNELIDNLVPMIKPMLPREIDLQLALEENLSNTELDGANFDSSLLNLVSNARDAMPEGGTLIIRTDNVRISESDAVLNQKPPPGDYVRLQVSDTGQGMDAETGLQVFDPYFTTKSRGQGTGLGLSMVHGFVRQSGGEITLDSTPGEGTTFSLYFPTSQGSADSADQ